MAETPSMSIEELLEHRSFVRRLAIRLAAGDTHLADDIAQETWLRTVKSPPPRADSVRAWLARVLRNVMSSEMRSRTRRAIREAAAEDAREEIEPKDALARQEVVARILQALVALDEVSRQVVLLRFYEDLPPRRIAELLDLPVETVRTRTRRALAALRAQLDASDLKEWRALFLPLPVMGATGAASSFEELKGAGSSLVPKAATLVLLASAVIVSWTILSGGGTSSKLKSVDAVSESAPSGAGPASDGEALEPEALTAIRQGTLPSLKGRSPMATSPAASSIAGATVSFRQAPEPPLSPATSEEPGVIRGRIVGPDGSPVPDAALAIRKVSTIEGGGQRRHRDQEGPLPVDGAATFEWRAPDGESRWEVEGEIRRTGLVIEHFIAAVEPGGVTDLGDISLRPAARVSGRVITPAGEPIAEARIELRGARPIEDEEEARATGFESELRIVGEELGGEADRSDADGRFTIDHLSPGAWRAWACTNETEYDFSEALTLSGGEVVEVELTLRALRPERTIRGVVRHQDGSPALDARVTVESTDQRFQRSARADEQGRFILYSARLESVLLFAEDESLVSDRHEVRFGESTTEILGTPRTRELIASDEGGNPIEALAALVMAPATSAPLLDLLLPIHGEGFMSMSGSNLPDFIWRSRSEGSDGRMQLRVPRESFRLFVEAPGFRRFELPSCSPTGDEPIAITMTRLPGITGFVRNSSGPVPGAVLTLTRVSERPVLYHQTFSADRQWLPDTEARSDGDGYFSIAPKEAGRFYLRVEHEGYAPFDDGPFELGEDPIEDLEVVLGGGGEINGRVILPDSATRTLRVIGSRGDGHLSSCIVDGDGRYRLAGLTPGNWRLIADERAPDHGASTGSLVVWTVYPHEVREGEVTNVDLEPFAERARFRGTLPRGLRNRGWNITLAQQVGGGSIAFRRFGWSMWAEPDSEGRFELQVLEPGRYALQVTTADRRTRYSATFDLTAGDHEWTLDNGLGRLEATVNVGVTPEELSVSHRWESVDGGEWWTKAELSPDGAFGFGTVPAGPGLIRIRHGRDVIREVTVEVAPDSTTTVPID